MSDQAMQVPLVELLRGIPSALRGEWVTQWSEDGFETGHAMAPVGMYCHQAAARIAELEKCGEHRQDILEIQEERIEELESRIHEAQEVYAGMEGFIPVHASEAYLQRIIDQMNKALLGGGENEPNNSH